MFTNLKITFNTKVKVWCKVEAGTLEKVGKLDGFALLQSVWLYAVYRREKVNCFQSAMVGKRASCAMQCQVQCSL